jgi:hypothetical protein
MDTDERITIHFEYNVADAVDAFRLYHATTPMRTISKIVAVVSLVFASLATYACVQLIHTYGDTYGTAWFAIGLIFIAIIAWFDPIRPVQAWLAFKMNSKVYTDPSEVTFDEAGVHAKTNTYDAKRLWTAYFSVLESKRLFLLVYGKGVYATIPKRAFSGEEQIRAFREMLERKIGKFG